VDILAFFSQRNRLPELEDELLYEFIAIELSEQQVKQGLWTKALADSDWNEPVAKAAYVKMRIEQLRIELAPHVRAAASLHSISHSLREAKEYGLTDEDLSYLRNPIKAIKYLKKYKTSQEKVSRAIGLGKLRGVLRNEVLWVEPESVTSIATGRYWMPTT
jgi:hypothetical protein